MHERGLVNTALAPVQWRDEAVYLLDIHALPDTQWRRYQDVATLAQAMREGGVQGASALASCAAFGLLLELNNHLQTDDWRCAVEQDYELLVQAYPNAMAVVWALNRMIDCMDALDEDADVFSHMQAMARYIEQSDMAASMLMAQFGLEIVQSHLDEPQAVLTQGLTGALGSTGGGSALAVIGAMQAAERLTQVYVLDTLPSAQGRFTQWELEQRGITAALYPDSAAAHLLKTHGITWVVVGAECISANGDVLASLGTYQLAINAMHHGARLMVVASSSSIDLACPSGDDLLREPLFESPVLTSGAAGNCAFDVTPADLIDYLVTEKGVIARPNREKMAQLMCRKRLH